MLYKDVSAVDDDFESLCFTSSEDVDQAVIDGGAMVFIPYIGVIDPQPVYAFFLKVGCQRIDNKVLPGDFGSIDPFFAGPVVIVAESVFLKTFVVGTLCSDRIDAQVRIDLAAASFFKLCDL